MAGADVLTVLLSLPLGGTAGRRQQPNEGLCWSKTLTARTEGIQIQALTVHFIETIHGLATTVEDCIGNQHMLLAERYILGESKVQLISLTIELVLRLEIWSSFFVAITILRS